MFGGLNKPKTEKEIEIENTEAISETSFNKISEEDKKEREQARLKALAVLFEKNIVKEKKEKMEMMMAWKLTEHLKLTNEEAEKFFPRFREHREIINTFTDKEKIYTLDTALTVSAINKNSGKKEWVKKFPYLLKMK